MALQGLDVKQLVDALLGRRVEPQMAPIPPMIPQQPDLPISRTRIGAPDSLPTPSMPTPAPAKPKFDKKQFFQDITGDFLIALGSGLANRGKAGQSTGAGAAILAPFQAAAQRQAQAEAQRKAQAAEALQAMELQLRAAQERRLGQPQARNIDPLSEQGIAATIAREAALSKLKPETAPRNIDPLSEQGIQAAIAREQALAKIRPQSQPIPGRDIPLPPEVEAQRNRMNATRARDNGLSPQQFTQVQVLSRQFDNTPVIKAFNESVARYETVKSILERGLGGPGDLATVYQFMKALDPTSVVRETEFDAAAKSGNIFAGWAAKYNGYLKPEGGFLPDNVKSAFLNILKGKLGVDTKQVKGLYNDYARRLDVITKQPGTGAQYLTDYTSFFEPSRPTATNAKGEQVEWDGKAWVPVKK